MSLRDYEKNNDMFEEDTRLIIRGFGFPCNVCLHIAKNQYEHPCRVCGHNLNAVEEDGEGKNA